MKKHWWLILGCSILLGACAAQTPPVEDRQAPLAVVNGEPVTVEFFERTFVAFLIQTGKNDTPFHRVLHLENLIDQALLAEEARAQGWAADSAATAFVDLEHKKALGARFYEAKLLETLPEPTDEELRDAFIKTNETVYVRHLFYRTEAEARAAYDRLQAGVSFLEEAQDCYQLAEIDSLAGYLGPIRYYMVDDAFAEVAFVMNAGEISPPVRTRFGYHIIRVDHKIMQPMQTEVAYQNKKGGIESQFRLRRRRLVGDAFVRHYMETLKVQVKPAAIQALAEAIDRLATPARTAVSPVVEAEVTHLDVGVLREAFSPETILLEYGPPEARRAFTAGQYYTWLPELPFTEAQGRPAASVGRALRNEVLAEAGRTAGFTADPTVQREVAVQTRVFLADRLRDRLRQQPPTSVDAALLDAAIARFGDPKTAPTRAELEAAIAPYLSEMEILRTLRSRATIHMDTLRFEALMTP